MGCPSCRNQLVDRERTSPTGRDFSIHKEQPKLGASQQTGGQKWNLVLSDLENVCFSGCAEALKFRSYSFLYRYIKFCC